MEKTSQCCAGQRLCAHRREHYSFRILGGDVGGVLVRKSRAFTLVELLVVIGIIALLVWILLPALNRAREQSPSVACKSNMRQIFFALVSYSNENRMWLPIPSNIGQTFDDRANCAFFMLSTPT